MKMFKRINCSEIDSEGFFLRNEIIDIELGEDEDISLYIDLTKYVLEKVPDGLIKPRFKDGVWIEGLSETEINTLRTEFQSKNRIYEIKSRLRETDWVESYRISHDLGIEILPETSSKWEIINERSLLKTELKELLDATL